jgi:hypothetical protein
VNDNELSVSLCYADTGALLTIVVDTQMLGFLVYGRDEIDFLMREHFPAEDARVRAILAFAAQSKLPMVSPTPFQQLPAGCAAALLQYASLAAQTLGSSLKEAIATPLPQRIVLYHIREKPADHGIIGYVDGRHAHHVVIFFSIAQLRELDAEFAERDEEIRSDNLQMAAANDLPETDERPMIRIAGDLAAQINYGHSISSNPMPAFLYVAGADDSEHPEVPATSPADDDVVIALEADDIEYLDGVDTVDPEPIPKT